MTKMTFEDFQKKVKRKTGFDKYWNYAICIGVFGVSTWLVIAAINDPEKFKDVFPVNYIGAVILFALGVFGLKKLPNRYKIVSIESRLGVDRKNAIIQQLLTELKAPNLTTPGNFVFIQYQRKWWTSPYNVLLFFDETQFAFSIQGYDHNGGFLDFGETESFRKRIKSRLTELISAG